MPIDDTITLALSHITIALSYITIALSHSTIALSHSTIAVSHSTIALSHITLALSHITLALSDRLGQQGNGVVPDLREGVSEILHALPRTRARGPEAV